MWESLPSDGSGLFVLEPQPWSSYRKKYCLTPTTKAHFQAAQLRPEQFTTHLVHYPPHPFPCPAALELTVACACVQTETVGFELLETLLPTRDACASKGFKRPLHVRIMCLQAPGTSVASKR